MLSRTETSNTLTDKQKAFLIGAGALTALSSVYFAYQKYNKRDKSEESNDSFSSRTGHPKTMIGQDKYIESLKDQMNAKYGENTSSDRLLRDVLAIKRKQSSKSGTKIPDRLTQQEISSIYKYAQQNKDKKTIYFDSNDEMYFEGEVKQDFSQGSQRHQKRVPRTKSSPGRLNDNKQESDDKHLTKIIVKKTEFEQKQMHDILSKQKKQNLQQFLKQVNQKKQTFANKKKRVYLEDRYSQSVKLQRKLASQISTDSEWAGNSDQAPMNLENRKFKNKGEVFWFNVFEAVTSNYLTKDEKDKLQQRQQLLQQKSNSKRQPPTQRYNRFTYPNAKDREEFKQIQRSQSLD